MHVVIDTQTIEPKVNFDTWMNEAYFHADQYKPGSGRGLDRYKAQVTVFTEGDMVQMLKQLSSIVMAFNLQIVAKILEE